MHFSDTFKTHNLFSCNKEQVINSNSINSNITQLNSFGKMGALVDNPHIEIDWNKYANHGNQRMIERGLSRQDINSFIENGKVLSQNNGEKFAYISKEGVAVVGKGGNLITAWGKEDFDNEMIEIVKKLFGD